MTKSKPQQESWTIKQEVDYNKAFPLGLYTSGFGNVAISMDEQVKSFISTQRTQILNEVREVVEGMSENPPHRDEYGAGYVVACEEILKSLNKLEEEHE